jgi:hypothetical protein
MQSLLVPDTAVVASNPQTVFDKGVAAIVKGDPVALALVLQSAEVHILPQSLLSSDSQCHLSGNPSRARSGVSGVWTVGDCSRVP